jgi:hypothetical protein
MHSVRSGNAPDRSVTAPSRLASGTLDGGGSVSTVSGAGPSTVPSMETCVTGATDGSSLGTGVGTSPGVSIGATDGSSPGTGVGTSPGVSTGATDGSTPGTAVGSLTGLSVAVKGGFPRGSGATSGGCAGWPGSVGVGEGIASGACGPAVPVRVKAYRHKKPAKSISG